MFNTCLKYQNAAHPAAVVFLLEPDPVAEVRLLCGQQQGNVAHFKMQIIEVYHNNIHSPTSGVRKGCGSRKPNPLPFVRKSVKSYKSPKFMINKK